MGRHRCVLVAMVMLTMVCGGSAYRAFALHALAAPVPGPVVLAFGDRYADGGRQRTHSGLDMQAAVGETVVSAAAGRVTFAGLVPADGGGRTYAVTVQTTEDLRVTLSPLESLAVDAGEALAVGDEVGTLAAAGDASVASTHLHLSVRVGETYVDPAPLLAPAAPTGTGDAATSGGAEMPDAGTGSDGGADSVGDANAGEGSVGACRVGGEQGAPTVAGTTAGAGVPLSRNSVAASPAMDVSRRAAIRARIGSAYCDAITSLRATRATSAVAFARRPASTSGSDSPEIPVVPIGGTVALATLLGMATALRRHARRELAGEVA